MKRGEQDLLSTAEEMRRSYREQSKLAGIGDEVGEVRNLLIPADKPARDVPLRIYLPLQENHDNLPIILFIHGGGFVSGDFDTHDVLCRAVSNGAGCVVVSAGYRLAPEDPFPAGLNDVYAALLWLKDNSSEINGDNSRIIVAGDSAGGNIAAALTMLCREDKEARLAGLWLMYPVLSSRMDTESWAKLGDRYFPTKEVSGVVFEAYLPEGVNPDNPLISPLKADVENFPPVLIQSGGLDPLCDENKDFAHMLEKSGNKVQLYFYPKHQHGFLQFYKDAQNFPDAEIALKHGLEWVREVFYNS